MTREEIQGLKLLIDRAVREDMRAKGIRVTTLHQQKDAARLRAKREREFRAQGFVLWGDRWLKCTICGKVTNRLSQKKWRHYEHCSGYEANGSADSVSTGAGAEGVHRNQGHSRNAVRAGANRDMPPH